MKNEIKLVINPCDEKDPSTFYFAINNDEKKQSYAADLQKLLKMDDIEERNQEKQIKKLRKKNKELKEIINEIRNISENSFSNASQRMSQIEKIVGNYLG